MRSRFWLALACLAASADPAPASAPSAWFAPARRRDRRRAGAAPAVALYRRAAEAGLPEAEFNVGVMLDSGRGTATDVAQAATWYARAAMHGNRRAAYNLGQLYEAGEGVPRNPELARAWFAASDLAAARAHLADRPAQAPPGAGRSAPSPVFPGDGASTEAAVGGVELVWTAQPQPEPVRFFVEIRQLGPSGSREVFSSFSDTSGIFAPLQEARGPYAWRVFTIARQGGNYEKSAWVALTLSDHAGPMSAR